MNELKVFENAEFGQIRGVEIDGESWLVGKDVAERLGYSNASKAVMVHVDEEDKKFEMLPVSDSQIGNLVKTALINESGLYSLVLGSKLQNAKKFKRWVTSEVLPAIRKHGGYLTAEKIEEALLNPDVLIKLATELKDEREARRALESKVAEDAPKVLFADSVSTAKTSILIGELAKLLKQNGLEVGQKRLFAWMRENGYLMRAGSSYNMPTQRAMEQGLFEIKETTINNPDGSTRLTRTPKVTGKRSGVFCESDAREEGGNRMNRLDDMLTRYGECVTVAAATRIMGRSRVTVRRMLDDGRIRWACAGTMLTSGQ